MKEVVFDYEEFKAKVDMTKPLHHCCYSKCIDKRGIFYRLEFWITGIGKNGGHVVCYYAERRTTVAEKEADRKWYGEMVKRFAEPLGSTEGEWKE
jgi:hypothetical protein